MNIASISINNLYQINQTDKKQLCSNYAATNKSEAINLNNLPATYYNKIMFTGLNSQDGSKHLINNYRGCLFGGAFGDALGGPIEWYSADAIKNKFGRSGLRYILKKDYMYKITDDTQMSIFTADGLLKSFLKNPNLSCEPDYSTIYASYLDWYKTQIASYADGKRDSGLLSENALFSRRFPGNTCLESLKNGVAGSIEKPVNNSIGNGGVMRSAPIGLVYYKDPELAFKVGTKCAALTHGAAGAYLPAGYLASLIANIVQGKSLVEAVDSSTKILKKYDGYESTLSCISKAIEYSSSDIEPQHAIESIGKGGRGDEAIAIALYCALKNPANYKRGIIMAANHSGDSDSTASIAGNILGTYLGGLSIPASWYDRLELGDLLYRYADNLLIDDDYAATFNKSKEQASLLNERRSDDRFTNA